MDFQKVFSFLSELKENNNRDWFQDHKNKYEKARDVVIEFTGKLIESIKQFDPDIGEQKPKDCLFRIYRDVRFSKDKSPYKTNIGSSIARGGKRRGDAGYYLHIEPRASFLAGGVYMPPAPMLKAVRKEIYYHSEDFKKIIEDDKFIKYFGALEGEKLKRPPKDFSADFDDVELLKYKSYVVIHNIDNELFYTDKLLPYSLEVFEAMKPLIHFINRGIDMIGNEVR